jgi:CYTH domain-containing protein
MNEEGLRMARELDKKVIKAWTGHPHLRVINNHEDFNKKLNRVILEISHVLGLPQPIIEERKYIVELIGEIPDCTESDIVQTYLVAEPGCEIRLRRRGWQGSFVNVHTTKKRTENNKVLETERQVSNSLYESLLQQADPYRQSIRKHRKSFIWKGQYFELDTYYEPVDHLMILETKGVADQESVKFPPFIRVIEDITGNKRYYNYNLALRRS